MSGRLKPLIRRCIQCYTLNHRRLMLRFTIQDGAPQLGQNTGRGYYLCANATCLERAQKGRRLEKQYRVAPELAADFWLRAQARL